LSFATKSSVDFDTGLVGLIVDAYCNRCCSAWRPAEHLFFLKMPCLFFSFCYLSFHTWSFVHLIAQSLVINIKRPPGVRLIQGQDILATVSSIFFAPILDD
jgi:hypothetical protein